MEMKYSDLSALQKLCAASGTGITSDIVRVIFIGEFPKSFFPKLDYLVCTLRILVRRAEISIVRKIFYSIGDLTLFPYPRPRRCLKFAQEKTENYGRVSNALSQAPDARWNTPHHAGFTYYGIVAREDFV